MRRPALSPPQLLSLQIAGLLFVGGVLLSLPVASAAGHRVSVLDAFFTVDVGGLRDGPHRASTRRSSSPRSAR